MGPAIYPEIEGLVDGWPDDINGMCLARALKYFDKAAKAWPAIKNLIRAL
jgi:hypothetical protein